MALPNFSKFTPYIRIFQVIYSFVILGLSAYVTDWYNSTTLTASPSQINFLLFASLWSLLSVACIEVVPKFFPRASNMYIALGVEVTNVLFWFAGWVGLAVFLGQLLFCRGTVCHAAQADVVFSSLQCVQWGFTAFILGVDVFKLGFRKPAQAGPAGPMMKEPLP
ncbi:hypothetical protein B0H63DRAFT_143620 [Podospora didyma]|uniref:MARVEL domain-containing protein n=1 Tax=Podospora didyma TaxID=330526 RepID=A0AAE0NSP2_9PEZI|nr:hypothetical protein B0H63DRAFT_143620 [Podospora didyma]